jgi:hypothetical protein
MHQQALKRHQTPTAIFGKIQKPFYFIKISHKNIILACSNINNNFKQDLNNNNKHLILKEMQQTFDKNPLRRLEM